MPLVHSMKKYPPEVISPFETTSEQSQPYVFCACQAKSAFESPLLVVACRISLLYEDDDALVGSWLSLHATNTNAAVARRTVFLINHIALPIVGEFECVCDMRLII